MHEDWLIQIENREGLIILFVNYTFFSMVSLMCLLFVLCLSHTTSPPSDIMYSISFIAYSFVVITIILADYVVYTINSHREIRIIWRVFDSEVNIEKILKRLGQIYIKFAITMSSSKNIKQLIRNMSAGVIQIGSQEKVETVDSFIEEATPLSPSSKFSESNINIPGHNLIKYMMLSHWDNILGPRVVHFWNMGTSEFDTSFLSRISSQSLSGEICREVTSFIDHKLYEISDADVFVTAFIFTAMGISGPCVHALSIVIQKSDMTFFLNIQHLFLKCFERIIRKFKVNLSQVI